VRASATEEGTAQPPADKGTARSPAGKPFVDITDPAGVRFKHEKPVLDRLLDPIMPWMASVGAAAAAADYNNDGNIDLYVTNSAIGTPNKLFRNNGDGTFTDVAAAAGVARTNDEALLFGLPEAFQSDLDRGEIPDSLRRALSGRGLTLSTKATLAVRDAGRIWELRDPGQLYAIRKEPGTLRIYQNQGVSMDAVWGDYNNDGFADLYVTKWGKDVLYRSNKDGTFTDVTDQAGVGDWGNGNAAIWFDYNDDGNLDLYVGNYFRYVNLWSLQDADQMHEDFETARDGGADVLYRNNGDGTFTNVAKDLGVDDTGWSLDVGAADYDNDGDQDLVVANDFGEDRVFRNNGDATFTDVTEAVHGSDTNKGMNVDFGDYNNDGWLDLYITNIYTKEYVKEGNQLFRNMGDGTFRDVSFETNVYDGGWCWAGRFWDYDNNGLLDIMVANGYISGDKNEEYFNDLAITVTKPDFNPRNAHMWPVMGEKSFAGYEPKRVWRNEGNELFTEVAAELGLADTRDGRGLAIADFDNDGDLDVYISNQGQEGVLFRNDVGNKSNWLEIDLTGRHCNRDAIGTRVTVVSGGISQIREVDGGNGDHSQCPHRLHFGLGPEGRIDSLTIRWPTGYVEHHEKLQTNQLLKFVEDTPDSFLVERKRWKDAQMEARRLEQEKEAKAARKSPGKDETEPNLEWREVESFKNEFVKLNEDIAQDPQNPRLRYQLAVVLDKRGRREAALDELEKAVALDWNALLYANQYRTLVRKYGSLYFDRSIRFFENLVEEHPDAGMPRINKALSYVDKMPYPKLGIVSQGKLSNKSLAELDTVLAKDPSCWTAKYIRGMNHLHWPRKLGHAPLAIKDFTELIALQKTLPPARQRKYFALGYVGLGESYVKNRDAGFEESMAKARRVWEQGLKEYPNNEELKVRLKLAAKSQDELIQFIDRLRGLGDPVNTDLNEVWIE
jgi:tetratricopeptide (TPR) repeat protein